MSGQGAVGSGQLKAFLTTAYGPLYFPSPPRLQFVRGEQPAKRNVSIVDTELIIRASCGAARDKTRWAAGIKTMALLRARSG